MLKKFRSSQKGSLYEQWVALEQESDVREYCWKLIEFSAPLDYIPEEVAIGIFLNGLKYEIRAEIRVLKPTHLGRTMELDQKLKEKNRGLNTRKGPKNRNPNSRAAGAWRGVTTTTPKTRAYSTETTVEGR